MQAVILAAFPSKTTRRTPEESILELDKVASTSLYKFSSREVQAVLDTVKKAVGRLCEERAPDWAWAQSSFHLSVKARFDFYVEYKVPDDASKDAGKVLHGRQALERMFPELKAQHDSGTLKLDGLTKFHMFDWFVPEQQMGVIQSISKELMTKPGAGPKRARASTGGSFSSAKQCNKEDAAVQDALAMFKKLKI